MTDQNTSVAHRYEHQGLLGTVIDVRVVADDEATADAADAAAVDEIGRLERVFSSFDDSSELCRWRNNEPFGLSRQFAELMGHALDWQISSAGGFNPLAGELGALWRRAEADGELPNKSEVAAAAASIRAPRYEMVDGSPVATGDCTALNLNAIAKGYVVDRALDAASGPGVAWVCVNAGGDLAHRGSGSVRAGIENPHRPYDNEPPLSIIEIADAALATSGDARRGFRVGGRWFGHVLDPSTGWPVEEIASISVVAGDALTADGLATVAGVMAPGDAVDFLDGLDGVQGLVIGRDRQQLTTTGWAGLVINSS
ncbi:MAG: FAD:protein FMN transferase [Actinomycetia bacterium]|nr:FAD:protein FMN transferase [Actinomycetes bacterium]